MGLCGIQILDALKEAHSSSLGLSGVELLAEEGYGIFLVVRSSEIGESGGQTGGKRELSLIVHAGAAVQEYMHDQAPLLLVLPDIELLRPAEDLPVHQLEVVTLAVLSIAYGAYAMPEAKRFSPAAIGSGDPLFDQQGEPVQLLEEFCIHDYFLNCTQRERLLRRSETT